MREVLLRLLEVAGHSIVGIAGDMIAAGKLIEELEQRSLVADVAIVDGKLQKTSEGNEDGEHIAGALNRCCPNTTVIGYTTRGTLPSARVSINKEVDPTELLKTIENAPLNETPQSPMVPPILSP